MIDYSKLRFFNKHGNVIPVDTVYDKNGFMYIKSELDNQPDALIYPLSELDNDGSIKKITKFGISDPGMLYSEKKSADPYLYNVYNNNRVSTAHILPEYLTEHATSDGSLYSLHQVDIDPITMNVGFPSVKFEGRIDFDKISTDLHETDCIYILKETENGYENITAEDFDNRYKLMFVIDASAQSEFKMFDVDFLTDELIFDTAKTLDYSDEKPLRLNIDFCGKMDGVYEEILYMCLIDTLNDNEPYLFGKIFLYAEAVGEDERYRTLFANFGIPDPKTYMNIIKETGIDEDFTDNEILNRKSKELFLTYSEIFPYVGTYKALVNAVKFLGYDDIIFKEWYKDVRASSDNTTHYVTYDISYKNENSKNRINSVSIEERASLKKANWLSMVYHINKEVETEFIKDIPETVDVYDYKNADVILKLYALKKWLEQNIIAQNCRIIDIMGEGIYFEKYDYKVYSNYVKTFDYDYERSISPYLKGTTDDRVLVDGSAYITIGIHELDDSLKAKYKIADVKQKYFGDYNADDLYIEYTDVSNGIGTVKAVSDGYDPDKADVGPDHIAEHILLEDTFIHPFDYEYVSIKASTSTTEHIISSPFIKSGTDNIWIHEGEIMFTPQKGSNYSTKKFRESEFDITPEIYLERAYIRSTDASKNWDDNILYAIERSDNPDYAYKIIRISDNMTKYFSDFVKLSDGIVKYTEDNVYGLPMFVINGMKLSNSSDFVIPTNKSYILDIRDGKFAWENAVESHPEFIYLNFYYDNKSEQNVEMNFVFIEDRVKTDNTVYDSVFAKKYHDDPDSAFSFVTDFSIKVYKSGVYDIFVYGFDEYNNIYGKRLTKMPEVIKLNPKIELYTTSEYSNNDPDFYYKNEYGELTNLSSIILDNHFNYPYNYMLKDIAYNGKDITYKNISYAIDTPKENERIVFYNVSDRYKVTAKSGNIYTVTLYDCYSTNKFIGTSAYYNSAETKDYCRVECIKFDKDFVTETQKIQGYFYKDGSSYKLVLNGSSLNVDDIVYIRNTAKYDVSAFRTVDDKNYIELNRTFTSSLVNMPFEPGQIIKVVINDYDVSFGEFCVKIKAIDKPNNYSRYCIEVPIYLNPDLISTFNNIYVMYPSDTMIYYDTICSGAIETEDGYTDIDIEDNIFSDFIDNTYSIIVRDFDRNYADSLYWNNVNLQKLYKYEIPITAIDGKVLCKGDSENCIWVLYKQNTDKPVKILESYNSYLNLNIVPNNEIYDIWLYTYDEFGNLSKTIIKGAIKI